MSNQNHENANIYRDLCNITGDVLKGKSVNLPNGYRVLETEQNSRNNFKSVAYQQGDEIVLCYLGTNSLSIKDHATNLKMATSSKPSSQMISAHQFYENVKKINKNSSFKVIGHSEGGSEALYVGLSNNLPTVTFNAYGLHPNLIKDFDKEKANELVTNYRDPNDPVSKLRPLSGKTYVVENKRSVFEKVNPFGMISAHRISNFGDCNNAKDVETYKKEHKRFISSIDDVEITDKDIGKMPNELYQIYDEEISNRLSKGQILKEHQAKEKTLVGSLIKVSDYVRDDGTQVDGYYRKRPNYAS